MKTTTKKTLRKAIGIMLTLVLILSAVPLNAFAFTTAGDWEYDEYHGEVTLTRYLGSDENVIVPETIDGYRVDHVSITAFSGTNVKTLYIPANIKTFYSTNNSNIVVQLASVTVSEDNPYFASIDGVVFSKDLKTLIYYPGQKVGKVYEVPQGVETIGCGSFYKVADLEVLKLPDSVKTINGYAIIYCNSLKEVYMQEGVTKIDMQGISSCANLEYIYIPESVTNLSSGLMSLPSLKTIETPAGSTAEEFAKAHNINVITPPPRADIPVTVGTTGVDPNAEVHAGDAAAVISVNITWEAMEFTYEFGEWNTTELKYDGQWQDDDAVITIENRSNIAIEAAATFNKADLAGFEDVIGTLDGDTEIASALDGTAKTGEIVLTVEGAPTVAATAAQLGTVTVTIAGK